MKKETIRQSVLCREIVKLISNQTANCMKELSKLPQGISYISLDGLVSQYNKSDVLLKYKYQDLFFEAVYIAKTEGRIINPAEINDSYRQTKKIHNLASDLSGLMNVAKNNPQVISILDIDVNKTIRAWAKNINQN